VRRVVVWDFNLLGNSISTGNRRRAGIQGRRINALTSPITARLEGIARKPIITITRLSRSTVRVIPTALPRHIRAAQLALKETILSSLFLLIRRDVPRSQEKVNKRLVLADAVREHAAVVAVVVDAPLHLDDVAGGICDDGLVAPVVGGLVVVDAYAGIVAAGSASTNLCGG
jgi:hypothetical protein